MDRSWEHEVFELVKIVYVYMITGEVCAEGGDKDDCGSGEQGMEADPFISFGGYNHHI
jgi:hypothetical protein